jgi:hypothetical protein
MKPQLIRHPDYQWNPLGEEKSCPAEATHQQTSPHLENWSTSLPWVSLLFLVVTFFLFVIRLKLFHHGGWHVVERIAC